MANATNFGNEPSAADLITPKPSHKDNEDLYKTLLPKNTVFC